ncbi:MAG: hypothetical protein AAGA48_31725 [Myxococcota bacterium]
MHALSNSSDPATGWRAVELGVVRHHADTANLLQQLLTVDPNWVPALCLRGFALLFKGRRALRDAAAEHGNQAHQAIASGRGEPGDDDLVDALWAWSRDDGWAAEAALQRRLLAKPHDLFTVKLQHGLLFMMGQSKVMRERIEAHLATWPNDDPDRGYVLGATVFARVECEDFDAADVARQEWTEHPADDAWGLHAVAHLLHEQGRFTDALDWLEQRQDRWAACDRFGNHLDWHRALLHLHLGSTERALSIHDEHLRGVFDGDYRDMSNAVSILWRLEALGIDVGPRWQELAAACSGLLHDHGSAFADAHYVLAQLHGGPPECVHPMLETLREIDGAGYQDGVVKEVGLVLCQALAEWQRHPERALEGLRTIGCDIPLIGGSRAQRSLFDDVIAHLERVTA